MESTRPRFLSRRVVLNLMASTPIAVAAAKASAQTGSATLPYDDGIKFGLVAARLWAAFLKGVEVGSPAGAPVPVEGDVFLKATQLSAPYVLSSLDEFDPKGDHEDVYRCCIACGIAAAARAKATGKITQEIFHRAWCDTKACYADMATCHPKHMKDLPNDPSGPWPNPMPAPVPEVPECLPPAVGRRSVGCG